MCNKDDAHCIKKKWNEEEGNRVVRKINGKGENRKRYKGNKWKTKEEHNLPSHYHYYAVWKMGVNVCYNEDVKCATTPSVDLWMLKMHKINF